MSVIRISLCLIAVYFVSACSPFKSYTPQEPLSRSQYLELVSREYSGVSEKEVWKALEQVVATISLAEMKVTYSENSIEAFRNGKGYTYTYIGKLRPNEHGNLELIFDVRYGERTASISPVFVGGNGGMFGSGVGFGTDKGGMVTNQVNYRATYKPLFERLEYFLGLSDYYPTCDSIKERQKSGELTGSAGAICHSVIESCDQLSGKKRRYTEWNNNKWTKKGGTIAPHDCFAG